MQVKIEHLHINVGEVDLHVAAAGPKDGKPLLFLHGFPEYWYAWQAQLEYFGALGYRVYAPDLRGFGASDKPANISDYHIDKLAGDVLGLIDALGYDQVDLVGHDWGGILTWHLLSWHPQRLRRVVVLNAPHLSAWRTAMLRTPAQTLKSWYVFAFKLPVLPELFTGARRGEMLLWMSGLDKVLNAEDRARYRKAYAGSLKTMINWYRAALRYTGESGRAPDAPIDTPLLILWGRDDAFLAAQLATDCKQLCSQVRVEFLDDASHWLVHEQPEKINQAIAGYLQE